MAGEKSKSNGLRRRGKKQPNVSSKTTKPATDEVNGSNETVATTWWDRMMEYKIMVGLTFLVGVPYALYVTYLFIWLQRPQWVSMLVKIERPAFEVSDARQVLFVGTMSSGTTQMAHDLSSKLGLEIGHENSETNWSFVRDGTVSWFHGIRFLPRPGIDDTSASVDIAIPLPPTDENTTAPATETISLEGERLFRYSVNLICRELRENMGFHPFMFRDNGCSLRQSWEGCWKEECANLLEQEWGCALKESPSDSTCTTPYHKILHQVRNPLKTVESLVTKFCIKGVDGEVQTPFQVYASALFPNHKFKKLSCIEASGYYVYEYNRAILNAVESGLADTTFHVEGSTPCQVAELAGFFEPPTGERYQQQIRDHLLGLCGEDSPSSEANQPLVSTKNKYNEGQLSLEWDDLLGGKHGSQKKDGDRDLQQRLQQMAKELGYE